MVGMQGAPSLKRRQSLGGVALLLVAIGGCSLTDLDQFTSGDAGAPADGVALSDAGEEPAVGPACGESKYCALAPPQGWSFVAVRFGGEGDCPAGYGAGADLVQIVPDSSSGSLCGCSCGEPSGSASCINGSSKLDKYITFVCIGATTTSIAPTCSPVNVSLGGSAVRAAPIPPTQATCSSTMQNEKPPPRSTSPARSCALLEAASSSSCPANRRCITAPSGGYELCVGRPQKSASCPQGYPRKRSLGTSVVDTRKCDSCRCETTATCSNARVELFTTEDCTDTPRTITADNQCKTPSGSGNYKAARYQADLVAGDCKVVDEVISGSLSLTDELTVCCPSGAGG